MKQGFTHFQSYLFFLLAGLFTACGSAEYQFERRWPVQEFTGSQWGYMDESGQIAIPHQFDYATEFSEGLGGVNIGGTRIQDQFPRDGKWGFVDAYGRFLVNPIYDAPPTFAKPYDLRSLSLMMHEGYIFSEGLAPIYKDGRWYYIAYLADKLKDSLFIKAAYRINPADSSREYFPIQSARRFSEGLAAVYINGAWGYIDYYGRIVIEPQFAYPVEFKDGRVLVMAQDELRMEVYNIEGKQELPMYRIVTDFR
ncbi:MAG: WG repeat-containing protein, partial [Bacteroidota bacterium]